MVHLIPGLRLAHAYLVDTAGGLAIIDPGYIGSHRLVLRYLAGLGYAPPDLRYVILTHHHVDHGGCTFALCRLTGAQLAVHADDAPYLTSGRPRERATWWGLVDRLPMALARLIVTCAGPPAIVLRDGDTVAGMQVIHAPGHTPGSVCLLSEAESALFVGDVLNNERGLRLPPWTVNHDHRQARGAPRALLGRHFERAYFGHGPALLESASRLVARYLESGAATPVRTASRQRPR